jgi:hypothetical protein
MSANGIQRAPSFKGNTIDVIYMDTLGSNKLMKLLVLVKISCRLPVDGYDTLNEGIGTISRNVLTGSKETARLF